MRRIWWYAISALGVVLGEVVVNVISASIKISNRYYLAPLALFISMVAITAAWTYYDNERVKSPSVSTKFSSAISRDGEITLRGRRSKIGGVISLSFLAILFLWSGLGDYLYIGVDAHVVNPQNHVAWGVFFFCLCVACGFPAIKTFIKMGVVLKISSEGIYVRDRGKRFGIRWNELDEVYVDSSSWLVAKPLAGSPLLFRRPFSQMYDPRERLLKLCDINRSGIFEHEVYSSLEACRAAPVHRKSGNSRR